MTDRLPDPSDPYEGLASPDPASAPKLITGDPQDDMPVPGHHAAAAPAERAMHIEPGN